MPSLEVRLRPAIIALAVGIHLGLCLWGAVVHSPTMDEPAYLVSGISHWQLGNFDLCRVSPPLVRMVAAIPVMAAQPRYDWGSHEKGPLVRAEHSVGRDFVVANGKRSFWLFTLGRWACLPFTLIGAWISYRWAKELFGQSSAYLALLLWCFSPNILAHAQMLTPDTGVTALGLAACYAFWRWSNSLALADAVTWGVVLGCAVLAKTNALALFAAFPGGLAIDLLLSRRKIQYRLAAGHLVAGFGTAICILNLGYGLQGSFRPLGAYVFASKVFAGEHDANEHGGNRFRGTVLESIPVPLPAAFVEGIDLQKRDFENDKQHFKTYFRGQWYDHGWWWYYLYVVTVKVPEGTWALIAAGAIVIFFGRHSECAVVAGYLILPGLLLFSLPSAQTGFGHSLRYVLPAFPFAFLIASAAVAGRPICRVFSSTMVIWMMCSSLRCYPHSLSYFNQLSGGPGNGDFHLLDGNVDWGQDLRYALDWIEKHPEARPVYIAFWGPIPTAELGIALSAASQDREGEFPEGYYVVSANYLHGGPRHYRPDLQVLQSGTAYDQITYAVRAYHFTKKTPPQPRREATRQNSAQNNNTNTRLTDKKQITFHYESENYRK